MELTNSVEGDIEFALYTAIRDTISANIDAEIAAKPDVPLPFPKEELIDKILQKNFDQLEESVYKTLGPNGTIYLTGTWLMRPLLYEGKMISTMDYLKKCVDTSNIVFLPQKDGAELRKEIW
ncbi:hypothetical protein [uncultured Treponema sp.]|uniref:hypothetical protein n=1 Tax=uncultured Treponema sp. TaxID=162155 RepID=UPI0025EC6215|nr:hypothetical protein [uncultured Treponema sp.]